jgi:hypothetical protein
MTYVNHNDFLSTLPGNPHPKMTEKYEFIDTRKVCETMFDLGYEISDIRTPVRRNEAVKGFGVHEVDFRHPKLLKGHNGVAPRIIFMNSYDGSLSARIMSGLIRFACSNGLVLGDSVEQERFIHMGSYEDQLASKLVEANDRMNSLFDKTDRFETITLDPSDYFEMAKEGLALRFEDTKIEVDPKVALMPRREEDMKADLWTTWNRLQENLMRGGLPGVNANGNDTMTSPLNNLQRTNKLNRDLWDILEKTAELA